MMCIDRPPSTVSLLSYTNALNLTQNYHTLSPSPNPNPHLTHEKVLRKARELLGTAESPQMPIITKFLLDR